MKPLKPTFLRLNSAERKEWLLAILMLALYLAAMKWGQ